MNKFLPALCLLAIACQTPNYLIYQRSEYQVRRAGGLIYSNSPQFGKPEIRINDAGVEVEENWIVQNIEKTPIQLSLSKAVVTNKQSQYGPVCSEATSGTNSVQLNPGDKVSVRCLLNLPKGASAGSDLWLEFSIPTSSGEAIKSKKLVRAEDFK